MLVIANILIKGPVTSVKSLVYVLWRSIDLMKENYFTLEKSRDIRYPARTITDANQADDIALLPNTLAKAEPLFHSQEHAAGGTVLHSCECRQYGVYMF